MKFPKCPVCGFDDMPYPPVPFNVCPCCGTEFGVDDRKVAHYELTQAWIHAGTPWFDDITSPPPNWSPQDQLRLAGLIPFARRPQIDIAVVGEKSESIASEISIIRPLWNRNDLDRFTVSAQTAA